MYQVGERIVYGETGVCEVAAITERTVASGQKKPCYTLKPLYQTCTIYTPVDNTKVFMRPVISRDEALRLVSLIPSMQAQAYHSRVQREIVEHYESALQTHECEDLIELTMSIYAKKQEAISQNRRVSAVDERFMRRAEDLLFGELAVALEIPREDVADYISRQIQPQ